MKIEKASTVTKLVNRFDNELRAILLADLIAVKRAKKDVMDKIAQTVQGNRLSAA